MEVRACGLFGGGVAVFSVAAGKVVDMRRLVSVVVILAVGSGLVAVGWWAGRETMATPEDPLGTVEPVTYKVIDGTLGRTLSFAAVAEWSLSSGIRGAAVGTVTSVDVTPGAVVEQGSVLFTVDLRPVVAARGSVPSFRDMTLRDEGPDVVQLQQLLTDLGFYEGDVDGSLGSGTQSAVKEWQKSLGIKDDGVVRRADILFFPELPVRVVPSETTQVGVGLAGNEIALQFVDGDPRLWIPLALEQRSLVPLSAEVLVAHSGGVWEARIERADEHTEEGRLDLILEGPNGGVVCGDSCEATIPLGERTNFPAEVIVIAETSGPVVPVAALITAPSGEVSVRLADGSERSVTILVATNGLAVVSGVVEGDSLLLPLGEVGG
jgi:peptidoglycan hydrolase-like protein with peptidoglycan-binding domain